MIKCKKCGYAWQERVRYPKSCPECKTRLKKQKEGVEYEDKSIKRV